MSKIYKKNLREILTKLGLTEPDLVRMDQKQITDVIEAINTALATYETPAIGNATVADVLAPKTFSNAAGKGLVGACAFDADTSDADALVSDILLGKIAYVNAVRCVGTCPYTHEQRFITIEDVTLDWPVAAVAAVTADVQGMELVLSHDAVAVEFKTVGVNLDETKHYWVGGIANTTDDTFTLYSMVTTIADGAIKATSIKTAAGVEDITNWAAEGGTLIHYVA